MDFTKLGAGRPVRDEILRSDLLVKSATRSGADGGEINGGGVAENVRTLVATLAVPGLEWVDG